MDFDLFFSFFFPPAKELNVNTCWASEASPTLGCSIEISRDIYKTYYTGQRGI